MTNVLHITQQWISVHTLFKFSERTLHDNNICGKYVLRLGFPRTAADDLPLVTRVDPEIVAIQVVRTYTFLGDIYFTFLFYFYLSKVSDSEV